MIDIESIGVGVDTSGVRTGTRDLDTFGKSADSASRKADGLSAEFDKFKASAGRVVAVLGAAGIGGAIIRLMDQYTRYTAQLKLATRSQEEYRAALASVSRIAQTAQADLASIGTLYARLNNALRELGVSQKQVADVTETVGLALKVSGATAAESASAMLQLSQAFGSGVLRGEEFNAVNEAAPALMRALAESIGVPIGALRQMASDGKLTSDVLYRAFSDPKLLESYRAQAREIQTIGGAWQTLKNTMLEATGTFSEKTRLSELFAAGIKSLADALQLLIDTAKSGPIDYSKFLPNKGQALVLNGFVPSINGVGARGQIPLPKNEMKPGQILPTGARIGDFMRKDIGTVEEYRAELAKLRQEADKFRSDNALTDAAAKLAEYNAKMKELVRLESLGAISSQEAARYRAQFTAELGKGKKVAEDFFYSESARLHSLLSDDERMIEADKKRIANTEESARAAIDAMAREVAGWNNLSEVQKTSWEIQTDRYKDFDAQSKEELLRLAGIIDKKKEIADLEKSIADLEKSNMAAARQAEDIAVDETVEKLKEKAAEQRKMWESIEKTAHDAFIDIYRNGKSAFDRLRDTLKNGLLELLYQMTVKKWIVNIGAAVTGGAAGTAAAGELAGAVSGGGAGGLGTIKTVYDVVTSGFNAANIAFEQGIQRFGSTLVDFGLDSIGGAISQYSALISNVSPFIGAGLALLQGDIKGAVSQGIGAGIGMAIGGPVGGLIGGSLGSVVGGMFGGHVSRPKYYADARVTDGVPDVYKLWGNSDASGAGSLKNNVAGQAVGELVKGISGATKALGGQMAEDFVLGVKYMAKYKSIGVVFGEEVSKTNPAFKFENADKNPQGLVAMTFFESVKKGFIDLDPYLERFISASSITAENAAGLLQTLSSVQQLHESLVGMPPVFDGLRYAIENTLTPDTLGQFQAQATALSQYYSLFYTDNEKLGYSVDALRSSLADLGVTMPELTGSADAMKAHFRAVVEGIDQSTEAGRQRFEQLIALAPAFAQLADAQAALNGVTSNAAAIAQERAGIEQQLLQLQGNTAELRRRELEALDPANRALMQQVYALQDEQAAAQAAAQAEQAAAQAAAQAAQQLAAQMAAVAQQRYGLETQLLQEQGDTAALRARELEALDPSNRALQQQIWALQDQKAAAEAAARAAQSVSSAVSYVSNSFSSLTDNIIDEVRRLRGVVLGEGAAGFAQAQASFAIAVAKGKAGDQNALEELPGLSKQLQQLGLNNIGSYTDYQRFVGGLENSLTDVLKKRGEPIPSYDVGTNYVPEDQLAMIHQGEAIVPRQYNPAAGGGSDKELLAEIRTLNDRIARIEASMQLTRLATERSAKVLDDASRGKQPLTTEAAA